MKPNILVHLWSYLAHFICTKARRETPPSWVRWSHTAPAQHGHNAQTPEETIFWASLSDGVKAETSASVSARTGTVLVC